MTTILGIKTNEGKEPAVVLAADRQLTNFDADNNPIEKKEAIKIRKKGNWAFAYTGIFDNYVERFFTYLMKGRKDFEKYFKFITHGHNIEYAPYGLMIDARLAFPNKVSSLTNSEKRLVDIAGGKAQTRGKFEKELIEIVKKICEMKKEPIEDAIRIGYFFELDWLNKMFRLRDGIDESAYTELIVAANYDSQPELYHFNSDGFILSRSPAPIEYVCLSTDDKSIREYMDERKYTEESEKKYFHENFGIDEIETFNIKVEEAYAIAFRLINGSKDIFTGSSGETPDIYVITKDKIEDEGKEVREKITQRQKGALREKVISLRERYL